MLSASSLPSFLFDPVPYPEPIRVNSCTLPFARTGPSTPAPHAKTGLQRAVGNAAKCVPQKVASFGNGLLQKMQMFDPTLL